MTAWSLSPGQRADVVRRIASSLACLAHARGGEIADADAAAAASSIERKAYTAAEVASNVTTGTRPAIETTKGYTRKLAELVLEAVENGGKASAQGSAGSGEAQTVDLFDPHDRAFLTADLTEEVLKDMLAPGSVVSKIRFSTKSFGRDAAAVAAKAIANVAGSLRHADISDVIAGRPEDEALDALRTLCGALAGCQLSVLNLSDNALGEKGVRACASAITSQAGLQSLSLQNVGCSIHACAAVEELLQASGELRQLHLFNNMSADAGAEHIAKILARAPKMEDFRMASSRVGPGGGSALARGLCAGQCLTRLDVSDNPMTAEAAAALAACVAQQPNLTYLNLNDTALTDDGVTEVCRALAAAAPKLQELELALNEVTPDSAAALALALLNKPALWRVNIRENELEDKGAVIISRAVAALPSLRVLDACGNQIRRVGCTSLARAAISRPGLEMLMLDENMMSEAGLEEVQEIFESAKKSHALGPLEENMEEDDEELDDEDAGELGDALADALAKATI